MNRAFSISKVAALTVAGLIAQQANASPYNWAAGSGNHEWTVDSNWDVGFSYPGAAAADDANLSVGLGGDLTVNITGPLANPLSNLYLGATDDAYTTTITGSGGATLSTANITSGGADGAVNNINATFLMPNGNLTIQPSTNSAGLNFGGTSFINTNPSSGTYRDVRNESGQQLTIANDIVLTDNAVAGNLRFRNNSNSTVTQLDGVISDGTTAGGKVNYAKGTFIINGANTYTGQTQLNENSPNGSAVFILGNDQAFGLGTSLVVSGGGSQVQTIQGAAGMGTRTLAQNITISRAVGFAGTENIVLNGNLIQSNTNTMPNNIVAGKTLTVNGTIYTAKSDPGRIFSFDGSGTTVINGAIVDSVSAITDFNGSIDQKGSGTVIIASQNSYGGETRITGSGKVQVGNGGATGSIGNTVVAGTSTSTGSLVVKRSDDLTFSNPIVGSLTGFTKSGSNIVTLDRTNFHGGSNSVESGTLLVNGGTIAQQNQAGVISNAGAGVMTYRTISGINTAGLQVGQPVWLDGASYDGSFIRSIDSSSQVTVSTVGSQLPTGLAAQNVVFGAGTGLGYGTTLVRNTATLGGTGSIGGTVVALTGGKIAPGASIESLDVGGAQFNSGSTLQIEFDGTGSGSIDLLNVAGALTINSGAKLDFSQLGTSLNGVDSYVFATYGTLSGTWDPANITGLPQGYSIDYHHNGNNIAVAVPEPAMAGLLGLASVFGLRRRRR